MKKLSTTPLRSAVTAIKAKTKFSNYNNKLTKTLSLADSPNLSAAKLAFDSISSSAADLDALRFHNSLLQSYASVSTALSDSVSLLRHMTSASPAFSPDRSTYHILLAQSCAAADPTLSTVHAALNLMSHAGFPPDKASADIAVRALVSAGRIESALQVFEEMCVKNSAPDTYTYNFLVKWLCKCRPLGTIYGFMEKSRASFGVRPDLVTYTILIDNVCNSGNLREMTRLVGVLGEEGFKPDCFLFNTIMKGHCLAGRGSQAAEVFRRMKESGVRPDVVSHNTLVFALASGGRAREAARHLEAMRAEGLAPDAAAYTALMNGLCRERDPLGAHALLEEMRGRGCSPNARTFNTLLHGFFKARMLDRGMGLLRGMVGAGTELDPAAYGVAVRALCGAGRVAEAYQVFDHAVRGRGLPEAAAAYATLESTLRAVNRAREFRPHSF